MKTRKIVSFILIIVVIVGIMMRREIVKLLSLNPLIQRKDVVDTMKDLHQLTFNGDINDLWNDPVALAISEATGVKIKVDTGNQEDDQNTQLMIALQSYPDLIFTKDQAYDLISAGALIDMSELIEEYGPNIKKIYGDQFFRLRYTKDDPSIYMLSSYSMGDTKYTQSGVAQIQWQVLKENNYQLPKSIKDYEMMLKNYMKEHPTTDDGLPTVGITLSTMDWHWKITLSNPAGFITSGELDNGQWSIDEDYNITYRTRKEEEKEYYRWLNRMYHEGVLDPEFAIQTHDDYIAKIASGRVLSLQDVHWSYGNADIELRVNGKLEKTYAGIPLTWDESIICSSMADVGLITGQGVGISSKCKDPVLAIKFLDFLCSDEGQILLNWGIEGLNYDVKEDGQRVRRRGDEDYSTRTGVGYHVYPFPAYGDGVVDSTGNTYTRVNKESVLSSYHAEQLAACDAWGVELLADIFPDASLFEVPNHTPLWALPKSAEFNDISNVLDEITWKGLIVCIVNPQEEFGQHYDEMMKELEANGMYEAEVMLKEILMNAMVSED